MNKVFLFLGTLVLLIPYYANAQPGDPGGDPDVPIPYIGLLVAAGAAYGVKKIFNRNNSGTNDNQSS